MTNDKFDVINIGTGAGDGMIARRPGYFNHPGPDD